MSRNKILLLIKSLNGAEREHFRLVIKNGHRESSKKLLALMEKNASSGMNIDKAELFSRLYGQTYTPDKDYLLRNEMRLLTGELTHFVCTRQAEKNMAGNDGIKSLLYLQSLADRNLHELLEMESEKHLKKLKKDMDFGNAAKIHYLLADHYCNNRPTSPDNFEALKLQAESAVACLERSFAYDWYRYKQFSVFAELNMAQMGLAKVAEPPDLSMARHFGEEVAGDPYVRYLQLKCVFYSSFNAGGKEGQLAQLLDLAGQVSRNDFDAKREKFGLHTQMGLGYLLHGKHRQSAQQFKNALETAPKKDKLLPAIAFNYVSVLVHLHDYAAALQVMEQYGKTFVKHKQIKYRHLSLKSMCHIFLGQIDEAEACLPHPKKLPNILNGFYLRFITAIVYFLQHKGELAINEAGNTVQAIRYNKGTTPEALASIAFGNLLKRYFLLQSGGVSKPELKQHLQLLHKDAMEFKAIHFPGEFTPLPAEWLLEQVETGMAKS